MRTILIALQIMFFYSISAEKKTSNKPVYGPYYVNANNIKKCNNSESSSDGNPYEVSFRGDSLDNLVFDFSTTKKTRLVKGIMTAEILEKNGYRVLFNKTSNNPCEDKIIRYFITDDFMKASSCTCPIGKYSTKPVNPNQYAHSIIGRSLFYGSLKVTLKIWTDPGTPMCFVAICTIQPLDTKKKTKN